MLKFLNEILIMIIVKGLKRKSREEGTKRAYNGFGHTKLFPNGTHVLKFEGSDNTY